MYKAHINEKTKEIQTVKEHSENTADLCKQFSIPELEDFMYVLGLLHDVGKYQKSFQCRINGDNISKCFKSNRLPLAEGGYFLLTSPKTMI